MADPPAAFAPVSPPKEVNRAPGPPNAAAGAMLGSMEKDPGLSRTEAAEFDHLVACFEVVEEHVLDDSVLLMINDS